MTTKSFWELINEYNINIPIIQRDYAQGRENEKERRDEFLKVLYANLTDTEYKNLDLDFVYGRIRIENGVGEIPEKIFFPVDGQQRLTTLFLLHWYIARKEEVDLEEAKVLGRFSYDTRISSREFCKALVDNIRDIELPEADSLKSRIVNYSWYRKAWDTDPTIKSMLIMLEAIHEKFFTTDCSWERLKIGITFQLLDLGEKDFELTDELYIKMNARGKQLTSFENFKAWFIAFLEKKHSGWTMENNSLSPNDYFSYRIEKEWTDLFWPYHEGTHTIDSKFMNFFNFIAQMCFFRDNTGKEIKDFKYQDFVALEEIFSNEKNVRFLFNTLDWFYELSLENRNVRKENIDAFFDSFLGDGHIRLFENTEANLFARCISKGDDFENRNRIVLYCILHYIVKNKLTKISNDGLINYTRVIRNLLQATRQLNETVYNTNVRINDFGDYWKLFEQLAQENVYEFLVNKDTDEISSWGKEHLNQEKIKATIYVSGGEETERALFDLEEHTALNGLIHQFKPFENKDRLAVFSKIVPEIWNDELSASLVIRAMIACGFDGFYTKNCALGEMYFYGGRRPPANSNKWATVLTNSGKEISGAIVSLLDEYLKQDQSFSSEKKLQNIISESIKNNTERNLRYYFLKYPAMTDNTWGYGEYCYYAWNWSDYECERLTSVSSNPLLGWHINVFNIAVYKELVKDKLINYNGMWARYSEQSGLWLRNGINMFCGKEGWKINTAEASEDILSDEIKKDFSITDDLILKENEQKDRVEIAVSFIKRLFQ